MKLLLADGKSFFPFTKSLFLLITKDILNIDKTFPSNFVNTFNLNIAFKVAWAEFIKLKELTYTAAKKANPSFKNIYFTRSDITFSKQDQYAILMFKRSKILIILAATKNLIYPITALLFLFTHHPQPSHTPLFAFNNYIFSWQYVVDYLWARLLM